MQELLFYVVFISQILLISYYYPKQVSNRINYVLTNFPPEQYPKLYPKSMDYQKLVLRIYQLLNTVIVIVGCGMVYWYSQLPVELGEKYDQAEQLPLIYGMVQFIPLMYLEFAGRKQFKLMRSVNENTTRKADLAPRNLFSFISPLPLIIAASLYFGSIVLDLYVNNFQFTEDVVIKAISLTLCNGLFICIVMINLSGKRLDPHQASQDRTKQIELSIKSMVFISILASVFFIVITVVQAYDADYINIYINSFYFQLLAVFGFGSMLHSQSLKDMNFDVYKKEVTA